MSEREEEKDCCGGKPPDMEAKLIGLKAFTILQTLSGMLLFTGFALIPIGLLTGHILALAQSIFESVVDGLIILVTIYCLRCSCLYLCCSICGILQLISMLLYTIGFATFSEKIYISVGDVTSSLQALSPRNTSSSTTKPLTSNDTSNVPPHLTISIVLLCVLYMMLLLLCAGAFFRLSGKCVAGSSENSEDQEEEDSEGDDSYEVEDRNEKND